MKLKSLILSFIILAISLSGCKWKKDIVIGCILNSQDDAFLNGLQMYYDENTDDKSNIKLSIKKVDENVSTYDAFNELKEEGASIIISNLDNGENKFPQDKDAIIPIIAAKDYTNESKYCFKLAISPEEEAQYLADFIINNLKLRTVAVIYNSEYDYSNVLTENFKEKLSKGGGEVSVISSYDNSISDYKYHLNSISKYEPQVLLILDNGERSAKIAEQTKNIMTILPTFIGSCQWEGIEKNVSDLNILEGSYCLNSFSYDNAEPEIQIYVDTYNKKYNANPDLNSAIGYDSIAIAFKSIENLKKVNTENIVEELKAMEYKGVCGSFVLNEDKAERSVYVSTIINGEKVLYSKMESGS